MLSHGIERYHRPGSVAEAARLVADGALPLAGGTRLLVAGRALGQLVDLSALPWGSIRRSDEGLVLGAMVRVQDVVDSPAAHVATAGLLPRACRAHSASPLLRSMATVGGEAVFGAHDSPVWAALAALDARVRIVGRGGGRECELAALRDRLRDELVECLVIPAATRGTALESVAVLPSAPPLALVAVSVALEGDICSRVRVAVTGLAGPPSRAKAVEDALEGRRVDAAAVRAAAARVVENLELREDAHAPAAYRGHVLPVLTARAIARAVERARTRDQAELPRSWIPTSATASPGGGLDAGAVGVTLNGEPVELPVRAGTPLLQALRDRGVSGVKHGCETGECGACAVLVDGRPVASCLTLAANVEGRHLRTVEGLGAPDALHAVQRAFVDAGAIQCGFCTPAMELCAAALLDAIPSPTESEIRDTLAGCLCRCTGYVKPVDAVRRAAEAREP
jgi:aerobic-type carbon monoxide dehydrogenase small subunit (CoxS/CutS family)/CO/xanthine dehydrogenase FAD-binding subunit